MATLPSQSRHERQISLNAASSDAPLAPSDNDPAASLNTAAQNRDLLGLPATHDSFPGHLSMTELYQTLAGFPAQDDDPQDLRNFPGYNELDICSSRQTELQQSLQGHVGSAVDLNHDLGALPQAAPNAQPWNAVTARLLVPGTDKRLTPRIISRGPLPPQQHLILPSDEGYQSLSTAASRIDARSERSYASNHSLQGTQNLHTTTTTISQSLQSHSRGHQFNPSQDPQHNVPVDEQDQMNRESPPVSCPEAGCTWRGKTHSDFKKHEARHNREHICDISDCPRQGKGFGTKNDLDRHKKTVHKRLSIYDHQYKCFAESCRKSDKLWPRLDNFNQHLQRMHKGDDPERLMHQSEEWWKSWSEEMLTGHSAAEMPSNLQSNFPRSLPDSSPSQQQSFNPTFLIDSSNPNTWFPGAATYSSGLSIGNPSNGMFPSGRTRTSVSLQLNQHQGLLSSYTNRHATLQPSSQSQPHTSARNTTPSQRRSAIYNPQAPALCSDFLDISSRPRQTNWMQRNSSSSQVLGNSPQPQIYPATVDNSLFNRQQRLEETNAFSTSPSSSYLVGLEDHPMQDDVVVQVGSHTNLPADIAETTASPKAVDPISIANFLRDRSRQNKGGGLTGPQLDILVSSLQSYGSATSKNTPNEAVYPSPEAEAYIIKLQEDSKDVYRCKGPKCIGKEWYQRALINKHVRRHTKPYGCTFDDCDKRFGSKNDWKRHEQGQHVQEECWRCAEAGLLTPRDLSCHKLFWNKDDYRDHLSTFHGMSQESSEDASRRWRINHDAQPQFWCGFCRDVVATRNRTKLKVARFDHIAQHYISENRKISEWLLMVGTQTKGQIRNQDRPVYDKADNAEEDDGKSDESDDNGDQEIATSSKPQHQALLQPHANRRKRARYAHSSSAAQPVSSSSASAEEQAPPAQRRKTSPAEYWICCHCQIGMWSYDNVRSCLDCHHYRCAGCQPQALVGAESEAPDDT